MSKEFMEDVYPILNSTDERKWRDFLFEYFYRFTKDQKKLSQINQQNSALIFSSIGDKMNKRETEFEGVAMRDKYVVVGKFGLINDIAKKWMDNGMKETPEEMIEYIMSFITLF